MNSEYPNSITLTEQEIEGNPFCDQEHHAAFYKLFAEKAYGLSMNEVEDLDCRKLIVSKDIQDSWYRNRPSDASSVELTMALAIAGPKVDYDLPKRTVCWKGDCICRDRK